MRNDNSSPTSQAPRRAGASGSSLSWVVTLVGTAVGAGILFLPINAGSFGFWPLLVATIFVGPLIYYAHRNYARITSASGKPGLDVLQVVTALTGRKNGVLTALIYWLVIVPTVLVYGISITNTMDSFIVNQLNGPSINRWLLAAICVGVMTGAYAFGKKTVLRFTQIIVYPLIIALAGVSFYLIPYWDFDAFLDFQPSVSPFAAIFLILPVLVFSFSHFAAVSSLVLDVQRGVNRDDPDNNLSTAQSEGVVERTVTRIELISSVLLVLLTMFFVWSCTLAMGNEGLQIALEQNIPVLSHLANTTDTAVMAYLAPVITILAIASSFEGHMMGAEEGTKYLAQVIMPRTSERLKGRRLSYLIYAALFVMTTAVAVLNPSILDLISVLGGIFTAFIVYLLPMLVFRKVKNNPSYARFARQPSTIIIALMSIILMAVTIYEIAVGW